MFLFETVEVLSPLPVTSCKLVAKKNKQIIRPIDRHYHLYIYKDFPPALMDLIDYTSR